MNILITMAGKGQRFLDAGYAEPKFEVEVCGRSLLHWALLSLQNFFDHRFIFLALADHRARPFVASEAEDLGLAAWDFLELGEPTAGQAETAMHAREAISNSSAPVAIYNIDTHVEPAQLTPAAIRGAGWIPCFKAPGDHFSFVRLGKSGRAVEVREKSRISEHATLGFYWFSSFELFQSLYRADYGREDRRPEREQYVAPMYNRLLAAGHEVFIHNLDSAAVHCLGTPREVEEFRRLKGT